MTNLRHVMMAAVFVLVAGVGLGCTRPPEPLSTDPDLVAFVVELESESESGSRVILESHADKLVSRYIVHVTDDTTIFDRDGDGVRPVSFEMLELKHWVQVWFDGPLAGEFPKEGTAIQLVILGFQSQ